MSLTFNDIQKLEEKKTELFDNMGKYPEREQELAYEYFKIDQEIIRFYKQKNSITLEIKGNEEFLK